MILSCYIAGRFAWGMLVDDDAIAPRDHDDCTYQLTPARVG